MVIDKSYFLAETIKIAEQSIALSVVLLEQLTSGGKLYYSDSTQRLPPELFEESAETPHKACLLPKFKIDYDFTNIF